MHILQIGKIKLLSNQRVSSNPNSLLSVVFPLVRSVAIWIGCCVCMLSFLWYNWSHQTKLNPCANSLGGVDSQGIWNCTHFVSWLENFMGRPTSGINWLITACDFKKNAALSVSYAKMKPIYVLKLRNEDITFSPNESIFKQKTVSTFF